MLVKPEGGDGRTVGLPTLTVFLVRPFERVAVAGIRREVVEKSQPDDSTVAPPVDGGLQGVIIPGMPA